jgi:hypothetical protein
MEGNPPATDYAAMLADMEAKYVVLGNAIASLRALLSVGVVGPVGDLSIPGASLGTSATAVASVSLPRGAFLGKTVVEAVPIYLSAVRKKQTNKEIAQALKEGGLESRGDFDNYVTGGLFQLKSKGVVLRFDDGWGLAEWYPESFRTRVAEKATSPKKKKPKKKVVPGKAKTVVSPNTPQPTPEPKSSLDQDIEAVFKRNKDYVTDGEDLAMVFGKSRGTINFALGRLAAKHKLEKVEGGYRLATGNVQEIPTAKAS